MKRLVFVACLLVACGGGEAPAQSPSSTPAGGATTSQPPVPESSASDHAQAPSVAAARSDVDRAEQRLEAARSDCAEACRALASMERAVEHLCSLDSGSECTRAKERVDAARERVRAECGGCPP